MLYGPMERTESFLLVRLLSGDRGETEGRGVEGWRDGGMEGWRDGGMEGWRDGGMERWREDGKFFNTKKYVEFSSFFF
jgi:hypothetical protein